MKVKIDENLPQELAEVLTSLGHDAITTLDENLCGCSDDQIWNVVQAENRFLVTQDFGLF